MDTTDRKAPKEWTNILVVAAWFGLLAGLVEGTGRLGLQRAGALPWDVSMKAVSPRILWVATSFDLILFVVAGVAAFGVGRLGFHARRQQVVLLTLSFLAFLDFIALTERINYWGAIMLSLGLAVVFTRWIRVRQERALRFWVRTVPWLGGIALVAAIGIEVHGWEHERYALAHLAPARPGAPNVLVIVLDTVRVDHLSTYGYSRATTPYLSQLAAKGVLFENCFSASSWTLPSHASLLTGRYPYEHGAVLNAYDGRYPTLAQVLEEHGYRTAAFSANVVLFSRYQGFGHGFVHFEDFFENLGDMVLRTGYGHQLERRLLPLVGFEDMPGRRSAEDINRSAIKWLKRDSDRPFFVFLNYFEAHDPYLPPQPYRSKFSDQKWPGGIFNSYIGRARIEFTPAQLQGERDAYDGTIAYMDDQISSLMDALERNGLARNTLVIVTSDHGESLGDHGLMGHGSSLYLELIRVPLILWWPGHLPTGIRIGQPVSNVALPATLMNLLGLSNTSPFPGQSLAEFGDSPQPTSLPQSPLPLSELAWMRYETDRRFPAYYGAMESLVTSEWHFILHEKFGASLYKWQQDPGELHDLAKTPEGQRIVADFEKRLADILRHSGSEGEKLPPAD